MARAATKKARQAKQAPPRKRGGGGVSGSARGVEQELFFGRIRRSAKWVFALLAVVFAGSFVFLGVGSGNAGLGDVFQNLNPFGGGSSGSSLKSLQKKVKEHPRDAQAQLALAQKLEGDRRNLEAIAAFRRYLQLRPRSVDGLSQLAALYDQRARNQEGLLRAASASSSPLADTSGFVPGGTLGQAVYSDPVQQELSSQALQKQAQLLPELQQTRRDALAAYQKIAALSPDEPSSLEQVGIEALQVCSASSGAACPEYQTALDAFRGYLAKVPDAADAAQVKQQIAAIQQQLKATPSLGSG
jgi:tetratricopeptide (TPR) repeat protein